MKQIKELSNPHFLFTPSFILSILCCLLSIGMALAGNDGGLAEPIELKRGFILMQAIVNDQPGTFILDSGAPGLVLNKNTFKDGTKSTDVLSGIGGAIETLFFEDNSLQLGDLDLQIAEAYAIDLKYLEEALHIPVSGLIGLNIFENFSIKIDYTSKELELSKSKMTLSSDFIELTSKPHGHLNILTLNKGKKKLQLVLDTGSRSNLIDEQLTQAWAASTTVLGKVELVGADQNIQVQERVKIAGLHFDEQHTCHTTFVTNDFAPIEQVLGIQVDGILGQEFLKDYIVIISPNRKKLRLYKRGL